MRIHICKKNCEEFNEKKQDLKAPSTDTEVVLIVLRIYHHFRSELITENGQSHIIITYFCYVQKKLFTFNNICGVSCLFQF